jgi:dihydroflavonol-4-reductase
MHFDPSETFAELGLKPRPFEELARDAVHWHRERRWV